MRVGLSALVLTGAPAGAQERPALKPHRFDEDWRALCEPSRQVEALDALKCLQIAPDTTLTLGGELRERVEAIDNPGFGLNQRSDHAFLHRALLHADLRVGDAVRAFVQLGYFDASGREGPRLATDVNRLDFVQEFIDVTAPVGDGQAVARGGRQEISFGSQRLVSIRDGPNIRRSFDGGRVFWADDRFRIDAVLVRPVLVRAGTFDDGSNPVEWLRGVYATGSVIGPLRADIYYLDFGRNGARFARGVGDERRSSFGARIFGKRAGVDWDVEGVYQTGRLGTRDLNAWTIASDLGVAFDVPARPRVGVKADIASGDHGGRTFGTFNALYPKLPYFSEANLFAPANIVDVHPSLQADLSPKLRVSAEWNWLWRETTRDAVYSPPLNAIVGTAGRGGRFTGQQGIAGFEWRATKYLQVETQYVHFFPASGLRAVNGRAVDFGFASVDVRF